MGSGIVRRAHLIRLDHLGDLPCNWVNKHHIVVGHRVTIAAYAKSSFAASGEIADREPVAGDLGSEPLRRLRVSKMI